MHHPATTTATASIIHIMFYIYMEHAMMRRFSVSCTTYIIHRVRLFIILYYVLYDMQCIVRALLISVRFPRAGLINNGDDNIMRVIILSVYYYYIILTPVRAISVHG